MEEEFKYQLTLILTKTNKNYYMRINNKVIKDNSLKDLLFKVMQELLHKEEVMYGSSRNY
jgi:hypothetical protein